MRILLTIHHRLERNAGAPGITLHLGEALRELGHEVEFFSWDDLPLRLGPRAKELLFPEFVAGRLRQTAADFDVIDASTGDAWLWALLHRRRRVRPLLATRSHGLEHVFYDELELEAQKGQTALRPLTRVYHGRIRLWEVQASLRQCDLCLFSNAEDMDYAVRRLGVTEERARVFQNGVPAALLTQTEPAPAPDAEIRLAVVGTWAERKGIRYGVPALNSLLKLHPELRASLIGTRAPDDDVLAGFDPPVRERIAVVNSYHRTELVDLLRGHHIKVFPTLAEGQSLALLETMACGLAPVTTEAGARGVVTDGTDGLVVPSRDAQALQAGVERLLQDRLLLARLRQGALQTARNRSWKEVARRAAEVYLDALAAHRPGSLRD